MNIWPSLGEVLIPLAYAGGFALAIVGTCAGATALSDALDRWRS